MAKPEKNTIIIVGDWVVDEYWFLVRHHSDISSHTGFNHDRISSGTQDNISGLCGAGHVASVLYQLKTESDKEFGILGIGKWNQQDSEYIKHLVHSHDENAQCPAAKATFKLTPQFCQHPPDIDLQTLDKNSYTIRVIRQYRHEDGGMEQINRIDWEPEHLNENEKELSISNLHLPDKNEVKQIVVFDFFKGAVSGKLIRELKKKYSSAKWFVRSKRKNPEWLSAIKDSLEVNMVGPEVAVHVNPWENWLWKGRITERAKELLNSIPGKNVVVVSNKLEVIIRTDSAKADAKCFTGNSGIVPTMISQLGWPSAFFASLVFLGLDEKNIINEENLNNSIDIADYYGGHRNLGDNNFNFEFRDRSIRDFLWKNEDDDWTNAGKDFGILTGKNKEMRLEVWRSATALPNYVTCIKKKQDILNCIGQKLRGFFNNGNPVRSLCILLQADPGSGKTHLAKTLAHAFDFAFMRFDITQMTTSSDLLDLFDNIATKQASSRKKILVFIDEFNSNVKGDKVYSAFLTPLEEGIYVRNGRFFSLKPCVWVFAGTKVEMKKDNGDKYSDFLSRMDIIEKIDYVSFKSAYKNNTDKLQNEARLEQVYLGVTMIKKFFPDIHEISYEVLKQFQKFDPEEAPARKIRKLASSLRNVQYGRINKDNCGDWEDVTWEEKPKAEDKKYVKLFFS